MSTPRSRSAGMTQQRARPTERDSCQGATKFLAPRSIKRDVGTQIRGEMNEAILAEYAEDWTGGAKFPPPVVFFDGTVHWLADGFHRVLAAIRANIAEIEVQVMEGGRREAILHAVGANAAHGLRRSNADKERAVRTLLDDPEWSNWTDRAIGRRCGVDHKTVGRSRKGAVLGNSPDTRRTATRKGKQIEIETARINGGRKASAKIEPGGAEAIAEEGVGIGRETRSGSAGGRGSEGGETSAGRTPANPPSSPALVDGLKSLVAAPVSPGAEVMPLVADVIHLVAELIPSVTWTGRHPLLPDTTQFNLDVRISSLYRIAGLGLLKPIIEVDAIRLWSQCSWYRWPLSRWAGLSKALGFLPRGA